MGNSISVLLTEVFGSFHLLHSLNEEVGVFSLTDWYTDWYP